MKGTRNSSGSSLKPQWLLFSSNEPFVKAHAIDSKAFCSLIDHSLQEVENEQEQGQRNPFQARQDSIERFLGYHPHSDST